MPGEVITKQTPVTYPSNNVLNFRTALFLRHQQRKQMKFLRPKYQAIVYNYIFKIKVKFYLE